MGVIHNTPLWEKGPLRHSGRCAEAGRRSGSVNNVSIGPACLLHVTGERKGASEDARGGLSEQVCWPSQGPSPGRGRMEAGDDGWSPAGRAVALALLSRAKGGALPTMSLLGNCCRSAETRGRGGLIRNELLFVCIFCGGPLGQPRLRRPGPICGRKQNEGQGHREGELLSHRAGSVPGRGGQPAAETPQGWGPACSAL